MRKTIARALKRFAAAVVLGLASVSTAAAATTVSFSATLQGQRIDLTRFFAVVSPGEVLPIRLNAAPGGKTFRLSVKGASGAVTKGDETHFSWNAPPSPGTALIRIEEMSSGDVMEIAVFIVTPFDAARQSSLVGYKIGSYPQKPLRGLAIYRPPSGLIEIRPEDAGIRVSPHFTIGAFLCKQATHSSSKYLALRPELILKLEQIRAALVDAGIDNPVMTIMSGYRTPFYNKAIGNVAYSRHVWGGAADIFIDRAPKDGRMDDLNGNGAFDKKDAAWLRSFIETLEAKNPGEILSGGLGEYGPKPHRGAFVHVDVRGTPARWGR